MNFFDPFPRSVSRRTFLNRATTSLGTVALGALINPALFAAPKPAARKDDRWRGILTALPYPVKAKRIIWLTMAGGPSHLETLDYKPKLAEMHGKPFPDSISKGQQIAQLQGQRLKCFGPQYEFKKYGQSGQEISVALPHIATLADDICIIRSLHTEQINHDPAQTLMNTGTAIAGRPSAGSWLLYGLGSECADLPGFVVMISSGGGQDQPVAARQWHSGFLPSRFQGVHFQAKNEPVNYISRPSGVDAAGQGEVIQAVNSLNQLRNATWHDPEVDTRISQYEMAFKMQASVPGLMDISQEPQSILDRYGVKSIDGTYAANCLLARRLAERGVRFIQLYHRGWDNHGGIKNGVKIAAGLIDQATAALVADLKQRGLLDDTLVLWGGEFGRTPMAQGDGRDHHIKGFSIWMAGAGIKPGLTYGATDEFGYNAVEDVVHVNDLHATMLHLFGIEHTKLTYRAQGRDFRLTDIAGEVVKGVLA